MAHFDFGPQDDPEEGGPDSGSSAGEGPAADGGDAWAAEAAEAARWDWQGAGGGADVDELCYSLQGLPPREAEDAVRAAFRKSDGEASDADTLAVLLKIFRAARDAALENYDSWDCAIAYCRRLTELCDQNFLGASDDEVRRPQLPAYIVAAVYAECGRTLALAGDVSQARDRLQKSLTVYDLVPDGGDESSQLQAAAARASLARVFKRLGHDAQAQPHFLQALQVFANLGSERELSTLISEWCEAVGAAGADELPSAVPGLLAELAEARFGEGSELHLQAIRDLADACTAVGRRGLAGNLLATRARLLRRQCEVGSRSGGRGARRIPAALARADAETAEEEAAQALEESVPGKLEEGDLDGAIDAWALALEFREAVEGRESTLVLEMRASLSALRQAKAARDGSDPSTREPSDLHEPHDQQDDASQPALACASEGSARAEAAGAETSADEAAASGRGGAAAAESGAAAQAAARPARPSLLSAPSMSFRPAWQRPPRQARPPAGGQGAQGDSPRQPRPRGDDGWDA